MEAFHSMFKVEPSAKERLRKMRDAIADQVTDPDWIVLRAEFEAGALRNEHIRQTFVEVHRRQVRDGGNLIKNLVRSSEIRLEVKANEFMMIILNLTHGLAVTQKILGAELSPKGTRHLIHSLLDRLIRS
jgi:TetR/AcrR family transcriptional regulator, transcriptional repressor of aconitase